MWRWICWRVRWSGDSVFKRSINHTLNTLKAHTCSHPYSHTLADYEESNVVWRVGSQQLGKYMFRSSTDTDSNDNLTAAEYNTSFLLLPFWYRFLPYLVLSPYQLHLDSTSFIFGLHHLPNHPLWPTDIIRGWQAIPTLEILESGRHASHSRSGIIICNHHRTSLSQSQIQGAAFRAFRFESSSSTSSLSAKARNRVIRALGLERSLSPPRVMK